VFFHVKQSLKMVSFCSFVTCYHRGTMSDGNDAPKWASRAIWQHSRAGKGGKLNGFWVKSVITGHSTGLWLF
jgi:hypothetical protein